MNYQITQMIEASKHTCMECKYYNSMPEACNYPKPDNIACADFEREDQ